MDLAIVKKQDSTFDDFWRLYPKRPGANKAQALKQWEKRIKEGEDPQEILYGTSQYRHYCEVLKIEPQFIKQASTFIGPNKHYACEWTIVKNDKSTDFDRWLTGNPGEDDGIIDI